MREENLKKNVFKVQFKLNTIFDMFNVVCLAKSQYSVCFVSFSID